jgi:hypothetical protein
MRTSGLIKKKKMFKLANNDESIDPAPLEEFSILLKYSEIKTTPSSGGINTELISTFRPTIRYE